GGLVSTSFVKLLLGMRAWFLARPKWTQWFQPVAGGLAVGVMGWFVPQSLGIGYQYVGQAASRFMKRCAPRTASTFRAAKPAPGRAPCVWNEPSGGMSNRSLLRSLPRSPSRIFVNSAP